MKCPNCGGSPAQIKLTYTANSNGYLYHTYTCGCGATIEYVYKEISFCVTSPHGTILERRREKP